jgi:hypothetical protein
VTIMRPLGNRTSVRLMQSARVADQYRMELFPDLASDDPNAMLTLGDEYAVIARKTYSFGTTVGLSHKLSSRASLGFNYDLRFVESPADDFDFTSHTAGGTFKYQLTKYASARASYSYRETPRYAGPDLVDAPFHNHNVNAGIDFNRAFSISGRRTSLTFTTGSSFVAGAREEVRGDEVISESTIRPLVTGAVSLRRNFGQTWDAQVGYRRLVHFVEGFGDPIFSESFGTTVGGQLGSRAHFSAMAGYSNGSVGFDDSKRNGHGGQTASALLGVPLTRYMNFTAQYFYVRQRTGEDVRLPEGFPHKVDRHSARLGITFQFSVI